MVANESLRSRLFWLVVAATIMCCTSKGLTTAFEAMGRMEQEPALNDRWVGDEGRVVVDITSGGGGQHRLCYRGGDFDLKPGTADEGTLISAEVWSRKNKIKVGSAAITRMPGRPSDLRLTLTFDDGNGGGDFHLKRS
ncbi:hypothetical protein [Urbifossiella limnaea]|nr:hypothetical protein [Urbifossiella limnaea]